MIKCWINGKSCGSISVQDRSFLYGDGIFETILVKDGRVIFYAEHIQRLKRGIEVLKINNSNDFIDNLNLQVKNFLEQKQHAVLKIIITRGISQRGYGFKTDIKPNIILQLFDFPINKKDNGLRVKSIQGLLPYEPFFQNIKHNNRLPQIMAKAMTQDYDDALMVDEKQNIICCSSANIFFVQKNKIFTPNLENVGIAGITRLKILDILSRNKYNVKVCDLKLSDISNMKVAFTTNSIMGLQQIRSIDNYNFVTDDKTYLGISKLYENIT
jgi:aminodeoxychorismate lyase